MCSVPPEIENNNLTFIKDVPKLKMVQQLNYDLYSCLNGSKNRTGLYLICLPGRIWHFDRSMSLCLCLSWNKLHHDSSALRLIAEACESQILWQAGGHKDSDIKLHSFYQDMFKPGEGITITLECTQSWKKTALKWALFFKCNSIVVAIKARRFFPTTKYRHKTLIHCGAL